MYVPISAYLNILMYSICALRAGAESACFVVILLWRTNICTMNIVDLYVPAESVVVTYHPLCTQAEPNVVPNFMAQ